MTKKKSKSREQKPGKKARMGAKDLKEENESREENPLDFGGIPDRKLKKSLGCG
ncbi:MAG TPA: hypothetical protein VFW11_16335 [Cyclobacteriaceae bacterium]|nr:hypothetical protein [Cyclobacteriaceae bacterium]